LDQGNRVAVFPLTLILSPERREYILFPLSP
jgi:hypothetical protein